ncbi:MAG: N-acetylmuramoyl-L-alanine amidase [Bacteroidia bacterium]
MRHLACVLILLTSAVFSLLNAQADKIDLYKSRMDAILVKDKSIYNYIAFNDTALIMYADSNKKNPEKIIRWKDIEAFRIQMQHLSVKESFDLYKKEILFKPSYNTSIWTAPYYDRTIQKLKGYKIAIDAGHTACNFEEAKLEAKFIEMDSVLINGTFQTIKFYEAELTYITSLLLKEKLEAQGAKVLLTREKMCGGAEGISFTTWLEKHFQKDVDSLFKIGEISLKEKNELLSKNNIRSKFKLYNNLDFRKRAEKINDFNPDATIIIHYNVDADNNPWNKPSNKNLNMVFIPGAFAKGELSNIEDRFHFLRLLVCDDIDQSNQLANLTAESFTKILKIPLAKQNECKYLDEFCTALKDGVFIRNLSLLRLVKGAVIYGETLYQDNINEVILLSNKTKSHDGIKYSSRIEDVVDAYYNAIINYFEKTEP